MHFAAGIAFALTAVLNSSTPAVALKPAVMPAAQTVQEFVTEYFADIPVMIDVAKCESRFRQFDKDGNVLKNGEGSSAVGMFQILSSIHEPVAKQLGIDINTIEGNAEYARYLYETSGTKPWEADLRSKACWSKAQVIAKK